MDLIGFGEAMVLFEPEAREDLRTAANLGVHVAGAELNLCAAAARMGLRTGFCSRVGDDPLGMRVIDHARRLGIATDLVSTDPGRPTGLFLKDVQPDGVRRVHYYRRGSAASMMDDRDAQRVLATRPALIAISGITSALGHGPREAVRALMRSARAFGARIAYDPNLRPALGDLPGQVAEARTLLPHVDILLLGLDEAEQLFGTTDPAEVFRAGSGAEVILKAGADGCFYDAGARIAHLPSAASKVVDPVGAGDAFAGGYLAARLRGASPAGAAWLGSQLAAFIVASPGDTTGLPSSAQAQILLKQAVKAHPAKRSTGIPTTSPGR